MSAAAVVGALLLAALVAAVVFLSFCFRSGFDRVADALFGVRDALRENTTATRGAAEHAESAAVAGKAMHAVLQSAAKAKDADSTGQRRTVTGRMPLPSYDGENRIARETPVPIPEPSPSASGR